MWIARPYRSRREVLGMRIVAISAFAIACSLGWTEAGAQATNVAPPNPPRTQQEIMRERRAACADLREAEFRECMNDYVGTPDKSQSIESDSGKRDDKPDPPQTSEPQPKPNAPEHSDPKK
jgi:hypothetical protein